MKLNIALLIIVLALLLQLIGVIVSLRTYHPEPSRFSLRNRLIWDLIAMACLIGMVLLVYNGEALGLD